MYKRMVVAALFIQLVAATSASAKIFDIHFNHADQKFYSDAVKKTQWDGIVNQDDTINLTIDDSPLGIFDVHTKRINKADNSLSLDLAKKLGLPDFNAGVVASEQGGASTLELFQDAQANAAAFNEVLGQPSRYATEYEDARDLARGAFADLLKDVGAFASDDPDTISAAIVAKFDASTPKVTIAKAKIVSAVTLMKELFGAGPLGSTSIATFDADQEFDVIISFEKPKDSQLHTPPDQRMVVRFKSNWIISTTAGFGFSRLVDHTYTSRTVEVTPATTDKPAVTKKIAVMEKDDVASPDAAMFVHVTPVGEAFRDRSIFVPRQLSFGVGIGSNASGRSYLGISWMLGRTASLTLGAAGGKVKMLSRNVDVDNLGTTDPQASRRDVFRITPFIGISWRIAGSSTAK
jgi:hypothetical protein